MDMGWYNGYKWSEREAKFQELARRIDAGLTPPPMGPCALCGDPGEPDGRVKFGYHDEDYSQPYVWTAPAMYCLCQNCHLDKVHKRFGRPDSSWQGFLAHVRRGGYARELKESKYQLEVKAYRAALERGEVCSLPQIRRYHGAVGAEWFASLRSDKESLHDPGTRPRP